MRILNLDLDFFQDDIKHFCTDEKNITDNSIKPWSEDKVIKYLEENLRLSRNNKVRGKIVKHHDEAFYFWRELILNKELEVPFDLVHVDAHADLGFGGTGPQYITTEFLHLPLDKRFYPENLGKDGYSMNFSDYMLYAIGCNWIKRIDFVTNPKWDYDDLSIVNFKNFDINCGILQLKKYEHGMNLAHELQYVNTYADIVPVGLEMEVPFNIIKCEDYINGEEFDFVVLSISPGYVHKDTMNLIGIIREYIEEI